MMVLVLKTTLHLAPALVPALVLALVPAQRQGRVLQTTALDLLAQSKVLEK
jgi:hypothetical protein